MASPPTNKLRLTAAESLLDRGISLLSNQSFAASTTGTSLNTLNTSFRECIDLQTAMSKLVHKENTKIKLLKKKMASAREAAPKSPHTRPPSPPLLGSPMLKLRQTHRCDTTPSLVRSPARSNKKKKQSTTPKKSRMTPKKSPAKRTNTPVKKTRTPREKPPRAPLVPVTVALPPLAVPHSASPSPTPPASAPPPAAPTALTAEQQLLKHMDPMNMLCSPKAKQSKRSRPKTTAMLDASLTRALSKTKTKRPTVRTPASPQSCLSATSTPQISSPTADCMTPYEKKLKTMIANKDMQVLMLTNQLKAHGDAPIDEVVALSEARSRLTAALTKLMEGDESAQDDFDKWSKFVEHHPKTIAEKAQQEADWIARNAQPNADALSVMRTFVPPDAFGTNLGKLKAALPAKIAERIFDKKILWLIRADPVFITKIHIAELKTKFQANRLDLCELRAVVSVLPMDFENDADGKKLEWREKLVDMLREKVKKEEGGDPQAGKRDRAYGEEVKGPYDPDADVVKSSTMAATPYGKAEIDDIRNLCKEGGKFEANKEKVGTGMVSEVVPNKERIAVETIGKVKDGNEHFLKKLEKCLGGGGDASPVLEREVVVEKMGEDKADIKNKLELLFGGGKKEEVVKKAKAPIIVETSAGDMTMAEKKAKLSAMFGGKTATATEARQPLRKKEPPQAPEMSDDGATTMAEKKAKLSAMFGGNMAPPLESKAKPNARKPDRNMLKEITARENTAPKKKSFLSELKDFKQQPPKKSFMDEIRERAAAVNKSDGDKEN